MPSTTVYNMAGEAVEQLELSEQVFGVNPNMAVLHQVVTAQLVNRRQGNASTKTRAEVSGGGRKPYKQKGTGRARQGSIRAPHFRHGGIVFGPKPHPYHHDVPRKMRRLAIRSALSDKVANEKLIVLSDLALEAPRTKDMVAILAKLPLEGKRVLMMLPQRDENVILSLRNIPSAKAQHVSSINVVELLKHDCLIMPVKTVRWLEMVFGDGMSAEKASSQIAADDESSGEVVTGTTDTEEAEKASSQIAVDDESSGEIVTGTTDTEKASSQIAADDESSGEVVTATSDTEETEKA